MSCAERWITAGFSTGQTLIDAGCGPGYASLDLAEIVGPSGRVIAIDRSRRFLDAITARRIANITVSEADLDVDPLPEIEADGAWVRSVLAFVTWPKALLGRIRSMFAPGASFVIHEYFDYATWRLAPRSELFEDFVGEVMSS